MRFSFDRIVVFIRSFGILTCQTPKHAISGAAVKWNSTGFEDSVHPAKDVRNGLQSWTAPK
jgi:hypothetical protein